jgi:hypothetical protein
METPAAFLKKPQMPEILPLHGPSLPESSNRISCVLPLLTGKTRAEPETVEKASLQGQPTFS